MAVCLEDLTWSSAPTCQPPPCSTPDNSTGRLRCSESGRHCVASCQGAGLTQLCSCVAGGAWDGSLSTQDCDPACRVPTVTNGHVSCGSREVTELFQTTGTPAGTVCNLSCNIGFHATNSSQVTCGQEGRWTSGPGLCQPTVMVMIGGERAGRIVNTRQVAPYGHGQVVGCPLPPLPKSVKHGSAGFVESSLLVCGGVTVLQNHNRICWALEANTGAWRDVMTLAR